MFGKGRIPSYVETNLSSDLIKTDMCTKTYICTMFLCIMIQLLGNFQFIVAFSDCSVQSYRDYQAWKRRLGVTDLIVTMWFSFKICRQLDGIDRRQISFGKKCCNGTLCNDHFYPKGKMPILVLVFQNRKWYLCAPYFWQWQLLSTIETPQRNTYWLTAQECQLRPWSK